MINIIKLRCALCKNIDYDFNFIDLPDGIFACPACLSTDIYIYDIIRVR